MVLLVPDSPVALEATVGLEAKAVSSPVIKKVSLQEPIPVANFEVKSIPSKGMGIFATRDMKAGELIMRESPLILMPKKVFDDDDPAYIELWLDRQINRMTSEQRDSFYSLADSRFFDGENKTTLGIFYTNDMTFTNDSAALFPNMARANHSCTPNSDFVARHHMGVQDLVAVRPIAKNEEITLCYLPSSSSGSEVKSRRQSYTRKWYGFNCTCQACTLQGEAFQIDEILREKVRTFQSVPLKTMTLQEIEELVDGLIKIGAKLPYVIDVAQRALQQALKLNDKILAAKFFAICYTASDIVHQLDWEETVINPYQSMLNIQLVTIAGSAHLFLL